jgi:hypothetical protein
MSNDDTITDATEAPEPVQPAENESVPKKRAKKDLDADAPFEFYAVTQFTATVNWTSCKFAAGTVIDHLAGLELEAAHAPVSRRPIS